MNFKLLATALFLCISSHVQADVTCDSLITTLKNENMIIGNTLPAKASSTEYKLNGTNCTSKTFLSEYINVFGRPVNGNFYPNKEDIEIQGSSISDANRIEEAKTWLSQHLFFEEPRVTDATEEGAPTVIIKDNVSVNILPENATYPDHTKSIAGESLYTGADTFGFPSIKLGLKGLTFIIQDQLPPKNVAEVLNNAKLIIHIIKLNLNYKIAESTISPAYTDIYFSLTISIPKPLCTPNIPSELDLGSTTRSDLDKNGSANKKSFNLDISCAGLMNTGDLFKIKIQDMANVSTTNETGVLTNSAASKEKSNAVIQLINDITGQPFPIGKQIDYFNVDEPSDSFKKTVSAQIYNPTPPATPGKVEGKATFLIDYE